MSSILVPIFISFLWFLIELEANISLPNEHLEFYFKNNRQYYEQFCSNQQVDLFNCSRSVDDFKCWGYEKDKKCKKWSNKYPIQPYCYKKYSNYEDLKENKKIFYDEADFGYIAKKREEIKVYCRPKNDLELNNDFRLKEDQKSNHRLVSSLKCTDYLRFCEGENVFINFRKLKTIAEPMRYRGDVLEDADIGGWNCELDHELLIKQNDHKSPLQSWYEELEHFKVMNSSIDKCDLTINKTTYIMKLDATVNMYHHFCDFINLYVSLHLSNDFSLDKQILIWDTLAYRSNFGFTWNSFTNNPLLDLNQFRGKTVCFKHVVFPFLPRMVYGLYYNMPLIKGCKRSGLFHAFNRHVLNGLNILKDYKELYDLAKSNRNQNYINDKEEEANNLKDRIRITFLSRSTFYRKVLNEDELINEIKNQSINYEVIKVDFNHQLSFKKQLQISSKTDILIGIHGAGLTHSLFLPDWAVLFELFNCDDESCYKDLARLRGIKYITWKNRRKLKYIKNESDQKKRSSHLKFTDYYFDKDEFIERLNIAIEYVKKKKFSFLKKYEINDKSPVNKSFELPKTEL